MPDYTVRWIIGRALSNPAYRELLARDPQAAWAGYDLTPFDLAELRTWTPERLQATLAEIEEKITAATFDGAVSFMLEEADSPTNCADSTLLEEFQEFLSPDSD